MQKLIFKKLIIKGFGSIQDVMEIELTNKKLNLIKGVNGTGKSSIINSFLWCLYGETLKEKSSVELWDNLRDNTYKGTYVELHFRSGGISYKVIRMKNWKEKIEGLTGGSRLLVYVGAGKKLYEADDKREVQKFLIEKLGITADVLKNSVVFGQKVSRITQEKGVKRKEILDDIFNLAYVNDAKVKAQADLNELSSEISNINHNINVGKGKLDILAESINNDLEFNLKVGVNLEIAVKEKKSLIEIEKVNISKLVKQRAEIKIPKRVESKEFKTTKFDDTKLLKHKSELIRVNINLSSQNNNLDRVKDTCPTCNRPFNAMEVKVQRNKLLNEIKLLNEDGLLIKEKIKEEEIIKSKFDADNKLVEAKKNDWDKKIRDTEKMIADSEWAIRIKDKEITQCEREIVRIQADIEDLPNIYKLKDIKPLTIKLQSLKGEIALLESKLNVESKKKDNLDWLVTDALSNKGLKAFIFSHLLSSINEKLIEYEGVSGFLMRFEVGDNTKRDINITIQHGGFIVDLADLSGGQKQLLDIMSIFAIHDVLQQDLNIKTMFLDEVFESLSDDNIERVDELIQKKLANNVTIFLVTHLKEYNPLNSELIELELVNGRTKIK